MCMWDACSAQLNSLGNKYAWLNFKFNGQYFSRESLCKAIFTGEGGTMSVMLQDSEFEAGKLQPRQHI